MKLTITAIFAALFATASFAGSTENITGCATEPVEGANFTVRSDVYCALPTTGGNGADALIVAAVKEVIEDLQN
jgi:hypothetical protein